MCGLQVAVPACRAHDTCRYSAPLAGKAILRFRRASLDSSNRGRPRRDVHPDGNDAWRRRSIMSTLKVIEVLTESTKSWEDAAQIAVTQASETLHGVKSIYIKDMEATVDNGKIRSYRINAKISFLLEGKR
jgi:dodecin